MGELYSDVIGQPGAVKLLKQAAHRPVHAYLFVGPPGSGKRAAAASFAAALVCPTAGEHLSGKLCESCRRALGGMHPDVVSVERDGAFIGMPAARETVRSAYSSPLESKRKVIILNDFHLVRDTGPALLKTLEEPPATTVFVVLADYLPPELVTIASRCVEVTFDALSGSQIAEALVADGVERQRAELIAELSSGRLDRARDLALDPRTEQRRELWYSIPRRLDGTNATAAALADEIVDALDASASVLVARQTEEVGRLAEANRRASEVSGGAKRSKSTRGAKTSKARAGPGTAELEERHRRELRRYRSDELKEGLAVLSAAYRDRLVESVSEGATPRRSLDVGGVLARLQEIEKFARALQYNPTEVLGLQALLARLSLQSPGAEQRNHTEVRPAVSPKTKRPGSPAVASP